MQVESRKSRKTFIALLAYKMQLWEVCYPVVIQVRFMLESLETALIITFKFSLWQLYFAKNYFYDGINTWEVR